MITTLTTIISTMTVTRMIILITIIRLQDWSLGSRIRASEGLVP